MRQLAAFTVAVTVLASVPTTSLIASSSPIDPSVVDHLVFNTPLTKLRSERARTKRVHRWLITATDGCSAPLVGSSRRSVSARPASLVREAPA